MTTPTATPLVPVAGETPLKLTPRQWREILEDPSFLSDAGNRYERPRRFHGVAVEIVPEGLGA